MDIDLRGFNGLMPDHPLVDAVVRQVYPRLRRIDFRLARIQTAFGCVYVKMSTQPDFEAIGLFEARYVAFLETITHLRPRLHRYCARMTGSVLDGEDVMQEAVFEAYRKLDRFDDSRRSTARSGQIRAICRQAREVHDNGSPTRRLRFADNVRRWRDVLRQRPPRLHGRGTSVSSPRFGDVARTAVGDASGIMPNDGVSPPGKAREDDADAA
jgi:hypothetical protein